MLSDTLDAAARSCLSTVDMVVARISTRITAAITPYLLNKVAILIIIVSLPGKNGMAPVLVIANPTIPINTETDMEITPHTDAILLRSTN